jgi:hypothetical protein
MWVGSWVVAHERDLILAIIGAVVWDTLKTGSLRGVRRLRNKLSDVSVSRLRKRIGQLETYRDQIALLNKSDKGLYVPLLKSVIAMLAMVCLALMLGTGEFLVRTYSVPYGSIVIGPRGSMIALAHFIMLVATSLELADCASHDLVRRKM